VIKTYLLKYLFKIYYRATDGFVKIWNLNMRRAVHDIKFSDKSVVSLSHLGNRNILQG
jgi:hypothetical protein